MKSYMKEIRANLPVIAVAFALAFAGVMFGDPVVGFSGPALLAAVVTVKSALITNRDAVPAVLKSRILQGAPVMHARGVCAVANGDSIGSKYLFFSMPSNAVPISVRITCPDIGSTGAGDVGLYKATRDGGAVVDADAFKAAQSISGGALAKVELVGGNLQTAANGEKMLWELLGLSSDPQIPYDVCLTLTAASDAAGSVLLEADYVIG